MAYFLIWLIHQRGHVILFTRWTLTSAELSIIPEFIDKIELLGKEDEFHVTKKEIIHKVSGSKIIFSGIKTSQGTQTANLKSIQGVTTWVIDEAEELTDEDVFDKINLSIREKSLPNRIIVIMNPSYKTHFIYRKYLEVERDDVCHIHTTYRDNLKNLSDEFLEEAERLRGLNKHRYDHLFLGTWLEDQEGLLWNKLIIDRSRVKSTPKLSRVVISIDPAVTAKAESDETGIVVVGADSNGNGYVLDDESGIYTPNEWAMVAHRLANRWDADCYVAEKNQGGDMVESVIRQVDKQRRVKLVQATKGKYLRAEPVFSLYEQNRIFHAGVFNKLEQQMITFNPESNVKSPDRVDALVHGLTDLVVGKQKQFISLLA